MVETPHLILTYTVSFKVLAMCLLGLHDIPFLCGFPLGTLVYSCISNTYSVGELSVGVNVIVNSCLSM